MLGSEANSRIRTVTLDGELSELERLREFLDSFCERAALPDHVRFHLAIALEELAVNAIKHGRCTPDPAAIRIDISVEGDCVRIEFSDDGAPFNPLAVAAPELEEDISRRRIGGLGIHLVRCLIPEIRYERRDGRNWLFLTKPIEPEPELTRKERDSDADRVGDRPR